MFPSDAEEIRIELEHVERKLSKLYREQVWPLREAYAKAFPTATLPIARSRTPTQDKVARCPRCGGELEKEWPARGLQEHQLQHAKEDGPKLMEKNDE